MAQCWFQMLQEETASDRILLLLSPAQETKSELETTCAHSARLIQHQMLAKLDASESIVLLLLHLPLLSATTDKFDQQAEDA